MPIPELPGCLVPRREEFDLKSHVAALCQMNDPEKFPGSQPVSFASRDLQKLENQDFWVCEKSDGVRVLFLVATDPISKSQITYIIDRHNTYRLISGIFFPHHENPLNTLGDSIIDGELVIDINPETRKEDLHFLAFDCLVIDGQNVMQRPLDKRYGRLTEWFYKPYAKMIKDHPHVAENHPLRITVKAMNLSYHAEQVFNVQIPKLQHGNDGLIYTCVKTPYTFGTDPNILKWKPPSENSIDFKLVLRFPPSKFNPKEPDWHAKPLFLLHVWCGETRYEQYDDMFVEDQEWEEMKKSGEQVDDRIVEVHWDNSLSRWRMMRFRDDKPHGNHRTVVENIIQSIADGVEKDELLERSQAIRAAWKARQSQQPTFQQPSGNSVTQSPIVGFRYGPLAVPQWSKVSGPTVVAGMKR